MQTFASQMYATGDVPMPGTVTLGSTTYTVSAILKDDFFATTALYRLTDNASPPDVPQRVILKVSRSAPFLGFPLTWIGRLLTGHELAILHRLRDIPGVPTVLARHGRTGFIYEYIPGWTLDQDPGIPDRFFDQLRDLVNEVHSRNVVYVDMNKRGNIIIGDDSSPHLIDFQISLCLPGFLLTPLRNAFRRADIYHLYKHKHRLAPQSTTTDERCLARRRGIIITIHRFLTAPYRILRRAFFRYLYSSHILQPDPSAQYSRENNPARFLR
jgi:hypothetical protein